MIWFPIKLSLRRFFYLIIFLAILVAGVIMWLSQLDINQYRGTIEQQLSQMLEKPVQIGEASLTFSRGLALEVRQLQIGDKDTPLAAVPIMTATLELWPLLDQRIVFHNIHLHQPHINIILPQNTQVSEQSNGDLSFQLPQALSINTLKISDAELNLYQLSDHRLTRQATLTQLQAVLKHLQPETAGDLIITGQLNNHSGKFLFKTNLPPGMNLTQWRSNSFQAQLTAQNLPTKKIIPAQGQQIPATVDLQVEIAGTPAHGAHITTQLRASQGEKQLLSLSGFWNSTRQMEQLTKLEGTLLGIPLAGSLSLKRTLETNQLKGQLGVEAVSLSPSLLRQWFIPHAQELLSGQLQKLQLSLDHSWPAREKLKDIPRLDATLSINNLKWKTPELHQVQDMTVALTFEQQKLSIHQGSFHLADQTFSFRGAISHLFQDPQFALTLNTQFPVTVLTKKISLPAGYKISGLLPAQLTLRGKLSSPIFDLSADLTQVEVACENFFQKATGTNSSLHITGSFDADYLTISQAELSLGHQSIVAQARLQRKAPTHNYALTVDAVNLEALRPYSPLLQKIQVEGSIGGSVKVTPNAWTGNLVLNNLGAHLTSLLGKLRRTTGTIKLDASGMQFSHLNAGLGESSLLVSGALTDWENPSLTLDVSGTKIRAHDLIFRNQQLTLYDLKGHLVIDADGISFSPVNVRLEEGTIASVTGAVKDFGDPQVKLDISGEKVDVLDVINLFIGPDKTNASQHNSSHELKPIVISVHADQGIIGGFHFQNADGLITDNHKQFVLAPLSFHNGDGHGSARVVFDRTDTRHPLKISGHVNNINASVLHQDLFKRPGLISGDLDGDFYLEGEPSDGEFWPSARGGMHINISKGVLRKFKTLSKVFSILNIAQIFKGQLPDMDREGMPFSLLNGSVAFADGRATTNDLKITSDAMNISMVGWQGIAKDDMDFTLGIMPLGTVDKVITSIPIAGWVLTGENKAFLTAYFRLRGNSENPEVTVIPIDSVSDTVLGVFKRTLGLPGKLIKDIGSLFKSETPKKAEP